MRYLKGELYRIFHKKSFIVFLTAVVLLIFIAMFFMRNQFAKTTSYFMMGFMLTQMATVVVSAFVFSLVYLDDFKGKTLATTIASGQSRVLTIYIKQSISLLVSFGFYLLIGGLFFVFSHLFAADYSADQTRELLLAALESFVKVIGYQSLAAVFVYWSQNAGVSLTMLLLLGSGFLSSMIGLLLKLPQITRAVGDLSPYLFTNAVSTAFSGWNNRFFEGTAVITVALYLIVPTILASSVFSKRELSF